MNKYIRSYWPAIIWSAIIFVLLLIPGSDLPEETSFANIPHFDKWVHFFIFALFVALWCWATHVKSNKRLILKFIIITVCGILLGYLLELAQKHWAVNRDYDVWDILADAAGCLSGFIFSCIVFLKKIGLHRSRGRNQN